MYWLVVDRVFGPVLAQVSTATGSLTRRVKPERLARLDKMGMTTRTIIAKNGLYMQSTYKYTSRCLCADRVRFQPEVLWSQNEMSNSVSVQCKLQNKYYQLNLATVILRPALWLDPAPTWFFAVTWFWPDPAKFWLNPPLVSAIVALWQLMKCTVTIQCW